MAVKMDGMRDSGKVRGVLLYHPVLPGVCGSDSVDVLPFLERPVLVEDVLDRGAAVVHVHGGVVDEPLDEVFSCDGGGAE